jgi:hypothetical protein
MPSEWGTSDNFALTSTRQRTRTLSRVPTRTGCDSSSWYMRNDAGLNVVVQFRSANRASPNKLFTRSLGSKMYASREIDPEAKLPRPMADKCVQLVAFNTANGGIVHGVY